MSFKEKKKVFGGGSMLSFMLNVGTITVNCVDAVFMEFMGLVERMMIK